MNRMGMTAQDRSNRAGQNMAIILQQKYGDDWWKIMTEQFVESEWK
jgi:hypothetical protein